MENKELIEYLEKRFDSIDKRFEAIDKRLDKMDDRLAAMEESLEITRESTNALIGWVEQASNAIRFPLGKL